MTLALIGWCISKRQSVPVQLPHYPQKRSPTQNLLSNRMKFLYTLLLVISTLMLRGQGQSGTASQCIENLNHQYLFQSTYVDQVNCDSEDKVTRPVFICTGSYAYAYHSRHDCPGMNNCSGEKKQVQQTFAEASLGRVPCCRCWSNVSSRCKDDFQEIGDASGADGGGAIIALGLVTVGVVLLSNDVYVNRVYPFYYNNPKAGKYVAVESLDKVSAWSFGLRKPFDYSALEYDATYSMFKLIQNPTLPQMPPITFAKWGWQLNFIHQIFYRTPDRFKFYIGPSINYVWNFGYGGIAATQIELVDRLKLDLRYEWTTQTKQLQAGLIFTYQKSYFWW